MTFTFVSTMDEIIHRALCPSRRERWPTHWNRTATCPRKTPLATHPRHRSTGQSRQEQSSSSYFGRESSSSDRAVRVNLENTWVQFGIHVFVGTMAGGLSDTVAVWMLFNPKKTVDFQGAIPKNQGRLAKASVGPSARRLDAGRLQAGVQSCWRRSSRDSRT
jgi:hypothetical protein